MSRTANIHTARVYLREARARAGNPAQRNFCFILLGWAANARRRAMTINHHPAQGDLFGGTE